MDTTQPSRGERDVHDRLIRLETKLDVLLEANTSTRVDHENRIRRLEKAVYVAAGVAAASGGVAGSIASAFWG